MPAEQKAAIPQSPFFELLGKAISATEKVSRGKQAALIGVIVVVGLSALSLPFEHSPTFMLLVLVLVSGLVAAMTRSRNGLIATGLIFTFGIVAVWMLGREAQARQVVPILPDSIQRKPVELRGNVLYTPGGRAANGVQVAVFGHGKPITTNEVGYFEVSVPRYLLRNDSVSFYVVKDTAVTVDAPLAWNPFRILLPRLAASAPVASGDVPGGAVFLLAQAPSRRSGMASDAAVRVILDSLRVVQDGSIGATPWKFTVRVDGVDAFVLPETRYNDDRGRNLMLLGTETLAKGAGSGAVKVEIQGVEPQAVGGRRATGTGILSAKSTGNGGSQSWAVRATAPGKARRGDFIFYFTVVRLESEKAAARS